MKSIKRTKFYVKITGKIGLNDSQKGYETKVTVQNLGEDGKVLDMTATYNVSDICVDDKWKNRIYSRFKTTNY